MPARPGHAAGNVRGTCSRSAGLLLDEEERSTGATDGRLVVDEGLAGNADRLLDRLWKLDTLADTGELFDAMAFES